MSSLELVIVDRTLPSLRQELRQYIARIEGEDFARWMASPSTGRFAVIDCAGHSMESWIWNLNTETELIEEVAERGINHMKAHPRSDIRIHTAATPDIQAKMRQLVDEINTLLRSPRA